MKCRFREDLVCYKIGHDCLRCEYRDIKTLDGIEPLQNIHYFICPFCLYKSKNLKDFYIYNKKGMIGKKKKCRMCNNIMLEYTLRFIGSCSIKDLAFWVYQYPYKEFWLKCNRELFKYNLGDKGRDLFFDEYYKLKNRGFVENVD